MKKPKKINIKRFVLFITIFCLIITTGGIALYQRYKHIKYNHSHFDFNDYNSQQKICSTEKEVYKQYINTKTEVEDLKNTLKEKHELMSDLKIVDDYINTIENNIKKYGLEFKITAYDLSIASCGKSKSSRGYGETFTGLSLKKHSLESARVVAVDPKVIPLGSKLFVKFSDKEYQKYSGIYYAQDTGRLVKGKHLDLFLGDFDSERESKIVSDFGCVKAKVLILN